MTDTQTNSEPIQSSCDRLGWLMKRGDVGDKPFKNLNFTFNVLRGSAGLPANGSFVHIMVIAYRLAKITTCLSK